MLQPHTCIHFSLMVLAVAAVAYLTSKGLCCRQMARRCYHQYPDVVVTSNSYQPEAVLRRLALAYSGSYAPNDAPWYDRKWGICESPLCIRKSPPGLQQACLGLGTTPAGDSMWEVCKSIARRVSGTRVAAITGGYARCI